MKKKDNSLLRNLTFFRDPSKKKKEEKENANKNHKINTQKNMDYLSTGIIMDVMNMKSKICSHTISIASHGENSNENR